MAENNAINCLLNCYIREYALDNKQVDFNDHKAAPPAIFNLLIVSNFHRVRLTFPESFASLLIKAEQVSLLRE